MTTFQSVVDIATKVADGSVTATSVLEEHLARIGERETEIHAFNLVTAESARAAAQSIDEAVAKGRPVGRLAGVPIALKDNMCTRGVDTTCSS
ncbi:MAG: amidase family protein, partial [Actinomycetota bacterium]